MSSNNPQEIPVKRRCSGMCIVHCHLGPPSKVDNVLERVTQELKRAQDRFKSFNSAHEGVAVIEEEFLELREKVFGIKWDRPVTDSEWEGLEVEARQLAAMALRFLVDICEE